MLLFRALSALLSYPSRRYAAGAAGDRGCRPPRTASDSPRAARPARPDRRAQSRRSSGGRGAVCRPFDRGRALSLHLFEHLHGESRDRGEAMVELKHIYERAGFELSARELPDYLPVVLEYLSCRDLAEARAMLADCAHILTTIGRSLIARRSRYAAVLQALIVIAGESPIDAAKVPPAKERTESLDRDWVEEPAFAGAPVTAAPYARRPAA